MENNTNTLVVYDAPKVVAKPTRNNYNLTIGNNSFTLVRDVDFGKVPKAKTPSLWKSGAEKVLAGFGLYYDCEIVDSYKDYKAGFFYYEVKATAYYDGNVVRVGVGCANTAESSTGMATGFNTANSALKKAKKRAIVDLALSLGGLSDCFTQDLDDDNNETRASELQRDDDFINTKQVKRIFAKAFSYGITAESAKTWLTSIGITSTKEIRVKDYDEICEKLDAYGKSLNGETAD